jgi:hypothetical protein
MPGRFCRDKISEIDKKMTKREEEKKEKLMPRERKDAFSRVIRDKKQRQATLKIWKVGMSDPFPKYLSNTICEEGQKKSQ